MEIERSFRRLFLPDGKLPLPVEVSDAARLLGTDLAEASQLLSDMEAAGLIFRVSAPRVSGFYPTPNGGRLLFEPLMDHVVIRDGVVTSVPMGLSDALALARESRARRTVVARIVEVIDR